MSMSCEKRRPRNAAVKSILTVRNTNSDIRRINHEFRQAYRDNFMVNDVRSLKVPQKINLQRSSCQQNTAVYHEPQRQNLRCLFQPHDVLAAGDFSVYQGGADINDFFAPQTTPKRISQVCLLNDDYMLVKHTGWLQSSQNGETMTNKENTVDDLQSKDSRHEALQRGPYTKAAKYFCCHRNFRIWPIKEIAGDSETENYTKAAVNKAIDSPTTTKTTSETEIYRTITKISGRPRSAFTPVPPKPVADRDSQPELSKIITDTEIKRKRIVEGSLADSSPPTVASIATQTQAEEQPSTNSHNLAAYEQQRHIEHFIQTKFGVLVTPEQRIYDGQLEKLFNNNKLFPFGHDHQQLPVKTRRRRQSAAIRWLTRPFRTRTTTTTKSNSKMPAVIYKAYFVRWKKLPPPDVDYLNGFGIRPEVVEQRPKLRRWRSAHF